MLRQPGKQESIDLLHGGFDLLVREGFSAFSFWMSDHDEQIAAVFDQTARKVWLAQQASETRLRQDQRRLSDARLQQRAARRDKRVRSDARELEMGDKERIVHGAAAQRRRASAATRAAAAGSQQPRRYVAYESGFVHSLMASVCMCVCAASQWSIILEDLQGEVGVWGAPDPDITWMLDPTEGPYRMRKKARCSIVLQVCYLTCVCFG